MSRTPSTGNYDAHFGMVLTEEPHVCTRGYEGTDRRPPQDGENRPMNEAARCTEPASESNARGGQHAPARRSVVRPRAAASYDPPVAAFDPETGELVWGEAEAAGWSRAVASAPATLGKESWKWLFLQPLLTQE